MRHIKKVLKEVAQEIALRKKGLYKLTSKDCRLIEVALRLRIESIEEQDMTPQDLRDIAMWKRTWKKFL